jgi:hypothetical protein
MSIIVQHPDPSWLVRLQQRDAILWLGQGWLESVGKANFVQSLRQLLRHTWAAVFVDAAAPCTSEVRELSGIDDSVTLRFFDDTSGPDQLPPNRLPVYWLRGPNGKTGPSNTEDPTALLNRYAMLRRAKPGMEVFALGVDEPDQLAGLVEAVNLSEAFRQLVIVSPRSSNLDLVEAKAERVFHWQADLPTFLALVAMTANRRAGPGIATVLLQTPTGRVELDISSCIDPSHPISDSFQLVLADDIRAERVVSEEDVRRFLADPTSSWLPYATGVPFPRHREFEFNLLRYLKRFRHEGPSLSCTAWMPAENGSGATTTLRQLAFNVAREGYPVLIARPAILTIDFRQLAAFLAQAASAVIDQKLMPSEVPWIVAFDAEHTLLHWEAVTGLSNGLRSLLRSVVVLAVQPVPLISDSDRRSTPGVNRVLGQPLETGITVEQGVLVGEHLARFIPPGVRRSESEWRWFVNDSIRPTIEGGHSLFWVALRFWLLRLAGTEESLRSWLASKLDEIIDGDQLRCKGLLELAVMGKNRLAMPLQLLTAECRDAVAHLVDSEGNTLGLRRIRFGNSAAITYAHPLISEEILRIAQGDSEALQAIGMRTCFNLLDLELHLLADIIRRPAAGAPESIELIEELVTTSLRVDPREAPRNFQVRDRIVKLLEHAATSIWDTSQVFNHHVAKARRHLAIDPPSAQWTPEMRREQLDLAESHLTDALNNIVPADPNRKESDLNLCVSMALTLDARSKFEMQEGNEDVANDYRRRAEQFYERAQRIYADNSYVLENFARYKLRVARSMNEGEPRTRLVVEAITLLELENRADEGGYREFPVTEELAVAYSLLEEGEGSVLLGKLAARGSESANVALARLAMRQARDYPESAADQFAQAEALLLRISAANMTWRSLMPLYEIVTAIRRFDFRRRLELLDQLDALSDLPWPQRLRLEYAILLFQAGDSHARRKGREVYKVLRDELSHRSSAPTVPRELKFLRDPATGFQDAMETFIVVKNISDVGRSSFAIPDGWESVDVVFRPFLFPLDVIRVGDELDCLIQFTNFGPQAVPRTMKSENNE